MPWIWQIGCFFSLAARNSTGLSDGSLHELHTPCISCDSIIKAKELPVCSYGLGWFVEPYRGRHMIHHGGNIDGFHRLSLSCLMKDRHCHLTNMNGSFLPNVLAYNILTACLDWKRSIGAAG
ncbi:hypothetical protein PO124_12670 [Bacillus licheniformis]|nr:hypothetical protein [Bacillus licheniformis]